MANQVTSSPFAWLRSNYIPVVQWQPNKKTAAISLPDWLSSAYIDLYDNVSQYVPFQVTDLEVGQPDLVAYKVYGQEQYDWLIMDFNGLVDPYNDMFEGQILRIPDLQQALSYLKQQSATTQSSNLNTVVTI